jgi:hypothetical protein
MLVHVHAGALFFRISWNIDVCYEDFRGSKMYLKYISNKLGFAHNRAHRLEDYGR